MLYHAFCFYGIIISPQTGGPFIVGCPRMLIEYIRRYYFLHQGASRKGNKELQVADRLTFH